MAGTRTGEGRRLPPVAATCARSSRVSLLAGFSVLLPVLPVLPVLRVLPVLAALALGLGGCRKVDLPDGFRCGANDQCPSPYHCTAGRCYRGDAGPMNDGGGDQGAPDRPDVPDRPDRPDAPDGGDAGDSLADRPDARLDVAMGDGLPADGFTTSGCDGGAHTCSGLCVDNLSTQHCGDLCVACDQPAGSTATCDGKTCDFTCNDTTQRRCGARCVSGCCTDADCGTQGTRLGRCDTSTNVCSYNCDATTKPCGTACIAPTACCVADDCTVMAGQTSSCNTSSHQCSYVCAPGYKSCGGGVCIPSAGCCTDTECMAAAGPGQAASCNTTTRACQFTCTTGNKSCLQMCIRTTDCCSDLDCPNQGALIGHCDSSTRQCNYNCSAGQKPCGANTCIASASCCTPSDCAAQTGQQATCSATTGQCSFTCLTGFKACGTACIPTASCCVDADCPGGTGQVGACNTTSHACQYTCATGFKACGANTCIPATGCCTSTDCTQPVGQVGTCNTGTRMCEFACASGFKPCGSNTCIPSASCCANADCAPPIAGQVGTCNTLTRTCSFMCGTGLKDCGGSSCIATTACCTTPDCAPLAGATPFCSPTTHQCTYTCNANFKDCAGACIDASGCCTVGDCAVKTGATASCGSSHVCSYTCGAGLNDCGGGTCVNLATGGCCAAGDCAARTGATAACNSSHQCAYTCAGGLRDCGGGVCVASTGCCVAGDCAPRSDATISCNAGHQCVYACNASALKLGCQCTSPGTAACNGPAMKLPVTCTGGQFVAGVSCGATQNCDQRDGTCHDIIVQCQGQLPGFTFCGPSDTPTTCGPDLTTTTTAAACPGLCLSGVCQAPRCGDGKIQSGETCDDGNANPLDGCEPVSAPIAAARCTPSRVTSLSLGDRHTCALYNGGYVRCWGNNEVGQLGLGHKLFEGNTKPYLLTNMAGALAPPIVFVGGLGATAVVAGSDFTCALLSDGSVQCWGINDSGQLGLGSLTPASTSLPGVVALGGAATALSLTSGMACALLASGSVRCWGTNAGGVLGLGNDTALPSMTMTPNLIGPVTLGATATAVSTGGAGACALLTGGMIRCWGDNTFGELGLGNTTQVSATMVPSTYGAVPLLAGRTALSISLGTFFACARISDGSAQCWGRNNAGQLGTGNLNTIGDDELASAGVVLLGTTVTGIVSGIGEVCAFFTSDGGLRCWGSNTKGELGYPDTLNRGGIAGMAPSQIGAVSFGAGRSAVAVFPGNAATCALLDNNQVRCWGWNSSGQLGLGMVSTAPDFVGGTATTSPSNATATTVQVLPP